MRSVVDTNPERKAQIESGKKRLAAARRVFYGKYDGRITAGPIAENGFRSKIFIAVRRGCKVEDGSVLADSLIYEIDPEGSIERMTAVPREVVGRPGKAFDNAVIFACTGCGFIRVTSRLSDTSQADENSGLASVEWYREIPIWTRIACWLRADPNRDAACFSDRWLFRAGQAYLLKRTDPVYTFEINVIDHATGVKQMDLNLAIPFDGNLPTRKRETVFGESIEPPSSGWTRGPYLLSISGIEIEGSVLRIVLKSHAYHSGLEADPPQAALEFDLKPLILMDATSPPSRL